VKIRAKGLFLQIGDEGANGLANGLALLRREVAEVSLEPRRDFIRRRNYPGI